MLTKLHIYLGDFPTFCPKMLLGYTPLPVMYLYAKEDSPSYVCSKQDKQTEECIYFVSAHDIFYSYG